MKVEPRGKFGGVKLHLEPEEVEVLLAAHAGFQPNIPNNSAFDLTMKMGKKIKDLLSTNPNLLKERTNEEIIAILAKESEKAALQLERAKAGKDFTKVDPQKLQDALLKHVPQK